MGKKKPKFYVVWQGHKPGVYKTWAECQNQINGFSGAKYKSFPTLGQAQDAFGGVAEEFIGTQKSGSKKRTPSGLTVDELEKMGVDIKALAVDAACKGNPGPLEYQGVEIDSKVNLFHQGPYPNGTVNIGEFLAIVHALALLKQKEPNRAIYSDSRIGIGWVRKGKCRTKLTKTVENQRLFALVARAEKWLAENELTNPILKWETKLWGEIPADFGRK